MRAAERWVCCGTLSRKKSLTGNGQNQKPRRASAEGDRALFESIARNEQPRLYFKP